jgi:large subunit ribosomal protein L15
MKLHDLRPAPGAHRTARRLGRGHGSGRGKTAGRGTKGQKARSGGNLPAWFEGGQTPLHVRTPKLPGFKNRFRVAYAPLNLGRLTGAAGGTLITPDVLEHDGLIRDQKLPVKILGVGDAPEGVTIHAHAFSRTAREKLEAAGSTVVRLTWPDNTPAEDAEEADDDQRAAAGDEAHEDRDAGAPLDADAPAERAEPAADDGEVGGADAEPEV